MSLHPQDIPAVPPTTATTARAAFPQGNRYMTMRDELGTFYADQDFAALFATRGQPAETPWRLALVLVFQFAEGLSDEQAADAVRSRIDWKYALSLELSDPGFDASVLSEFRTRIVAGQAEQQLLDTLLQRFKTAGLLKARGRQRTDSTHVLAAVRQVNRLVLVGETVRHALNTLAVAAPQWLQPRLEPAWVERYGARLDDYRLPQGQAARQALAAQIGADGRTLLTALCAADAPDWLRQLPAVETLRQIWVQQYEAVPDREPMRWRTQTDQPPAAQHIDSPYDPEARYGNKRTTQWFGYKAHLTETCDDDAPHLITHVLTTVASTPDFDAPAPIHRALAAKELLPAEHLLDAGYTDADLFVTASQEHHMTVIGPVPPNHSWQAVAQTGFDVAAFTLDWEAQRATCPQGNTNDKWSETRDQDGTPIINIRFKAKVCAACAERPHCTHSATAPRHLTVRRRPQYEALQQARRDQQTPEFKHRYQARAGIEGTLSQGVRTADLRRSRYIGLAKTHLQHILVAAALNLRRITDWLMDVPRAHTRTAPFVRLVQAAV
jgi:transposase